MNTKEFIKAFAEKLEVSQKEAAGLLEQTTGLLRDVVSEEKKLTIVNLGYFKVKKTRSRTAFIPALGLKALVPPRRVVQFNPADTLKGKLKNTTRS
jgi:DNA-binding protein HU-beta